MSAQATRATNATDANHPPHRLAVPIAFALVYVIWGSTYLGIRYAIETIPPFFMAGTRFFVAGVFLYGWSRARGGPKPTPLQWRNATIAGLLLLLFGNGLLTFAETRVPSGLAAVIVATVPLWMVVLDWLTGGAPRPGPRAWLGIALGLAGVAALMRHTTGSGGIDPIGAGVLLVASLGWSLGSLFGRRADLPKSALLTTGMEMLTGGAMLMLAGLATGEAAHFSLAAVSRTSLLGLVYLITLGSIIGYSAYTYLVTATTPAKLGTYAYVNPVIAVILGATIASEPIGPMTLVAMAMIVGAVILLTVKPRAAAAATPTLAAES